MAASSVSFTPSQMAKYVALTAALIGTVVLSYLAHLFPDWTALAGVAVYIPTVAYYVAHDLEATGTPNGIPYYTTFLVITVVSALEGAVGQFVLSNGTITLSAALVFVIGVLSYIFHVLQEDAGVHIPAGAENWAVAVIGVAIGLLSFYYSNPTAGIATFLTAGYTIIGQYVHISTDGSSFSATPVTPAPSPTTPT